MRQMGKRIGICLLLAALMWTVGLVRDRAFLNRELIRLHVVANSDSDEDQAVKLRVRDAVLGSIRSDLKMVGDVNQAKAYLRENLPKIQAAANRTLEAAGVDAQAVVTLEKEAFDICQRKILQHKLEMKLVRVECSFDGSKILFFFTADGRVDFRELVKDLAGVFRARIELRQIGVRDEAKMIGGLGICGRPFCCAQFMDEFLPVSIKMAKTQNLSLNPTKISGTCGRLMCCLNYEQAAYEDLLRTSPRPESFVDTPDGRGTVTDVNLLRQSVRVRLEKEPETVVCHKNCDICVLRNGKARKGDEPIPPDLAPISGGKPRKKKEDEPEFATYLEPVVIRRSAETLEPAVVSKPAKDEPETRSRRRRRKSGAKASEAAEGAQTEPAAKPVGQKPAEQRSGEPRNGEQKPRRDRSRRKARPPRDPNAPKSAEAAGERPARAAKPGQKPRAEDAGQRPRAESAAQKRADAPAGERAAAKPSAASAPDANSPAVDGASKPHRRRPQSRRRKPSAKPNEGAAE